MKDVGKAQQNRQLDALAGEMPDQLRQVDMLAFRSAVGADQQIPLVAHINVAVSPVADVVDLVGVIGRHVSHWQGPVAVALWPAFSAIVGVSGKGASTGLAKPL